MPKATTQRAKHAPKQAGADAPFSFKVVAKKGANGQAGTLTVTLSIPGDDEECPLTLDKIKDSKLDFLQGTAFCQAKPLHCKLTLPCKHSFHALSLMYSWCKTGMRCPCCRAGLEERADPACLPKHFQAAMAERVRETLASEVESDTSHLVQIYGVTVPYAALAQAGCLVMMMSFLESVDSTEPLFSFASPMDLAGGTEERPLFRPRGHLHSISNTEQVQVGAVQLQVQLDVFEVGTITIDASRPIAIVAGTTSVPGAHGQFVNEATGLRHVSVNERTRFEVSAAHGVRGLGIMGIRWCPEGQFMDLVSLNE